MSVRTLLSLVLLVWAIYRLVQRVQQHRAFKASQALAPARLAESPALPATTPGVQAVKARTSASEQAYVSSGILGLSSSELRSRALKINPYKTPWIGRVDTIPPQTDERTALIDRGLILRGLLTPEQIQEIHRVGDEWLRVHEAHRLAEATGKARANEILAEVKAERAERKAQKKRDTEARRAARIEAVQHRRETDIIFAGRGVSSGLASRQSDAQALSAAGLPVLATAADVAQAMGLTVPGLRWLAYHHESPERTNYVYFSIPKRSGGMRLIASPKRHLRRAQSWVREQILGKLEVTPHAHGFVKERSTLTNAMAHVGKHVIVNLDLKDFFPTISFFRVRGLFASLGYSRAVSTLLALICTEAPRTEVTYEGRKYWPAVGERALPQGACTSPTLANLVTRKLDRRLNGAASKLGFEYTRYADDLTFSAQTGQSNVALLLSRVRHIVIEEGFVINPKKGRVQRRGKRQEVTGVVVNDKPGAVRSEVRKLRAILHNAKKTGILAQNRDKRPHFEAWLRGKIGYVTMLDPCKGQALAAAMNELMPKAEILDP